MDIDTLVDAASDYASGSLDDEITVEIMESKGDSWLVAMLDDGAETAAVWVSFAGTFEGRDMIKVSSNEKAEDYLAQESYVMEAKGDLLARYLYC